MFKHLGLEADYLVSLLVEVIGKHLVGMVIKIDIRMVNFVEVTGEISILLRIPEASIIYRDVILGEREVSDLYFPVWDYIMYD